jgi:hypothetical protein
MRSLSVLVLLGLAVSGCKQTIPDYGRSDAGVDAATGVDGAVDAAVLDAAALDAAALDATAGPDAGLDAGPDAGPDAGLTCPAGGPIDCSPGTGSGEGDQCYDGLGCFLSNVQSAVNGVVNANPSWFDFNNQWNCPMILDVDAFMNAVVAHVTGQGLCVIRDPNAPFEEVTVKHDNAFSENFDIVASTGCARSGSAIYTSTCAPAWW